MESTLNALLVLAAALAIAWTVRVARAVVVEPEYPEQFDDDMPDLCGEHAFARMEVGGILDHYVKFVSGDLETAAYDLIADVLLELDSRDVDVNQQSLFDHAEMHFEAERNYPGKEA